MSKYLKLFSTHTEYENYIEDKQNLVLPNVSYCEDDRDVHYNPYVEPPFFCKLTLNDGSTVEIEGSGELTTAMTKPYSATCVSAEIGELCTSIGDFTFNSFSNLTNVTIPSSVTSVGWAAFGLCGLTSVTMPSGVTFGDGVFGGCSGLTSVTISNGTRFIPVDGFDGCIGLTNIKIPSTVTSIGDGAFSGCMGLTSITSLAQIAPTITEDSFNLSSNGTLYVPSGSSGYDEWIADLGSGWNKVEQ